MRKANKKQSQGWVRDYLRSSDYELYHVYGNYSRAKERSFENIKARMYKDGGNDLRILGHNSNTYTCAYRQGNNLIVDTWMNTYVIENWEEQL